MKVNFIKMKKIMMNQRKNNTSLLGYFDDTMPNFLSEYFDNFQYFDRMLYKLYSEFSYILDEPMKLSDNIENIVTDLQLDFKAFCIANNKYWTDYFATTQYEYNPIENYSQTETEKIVENAENSGNINYGQKKTTNTIGKIVNSQANNVSPYDTTSEVLNNSSNSQTIKDNDITLSETSTDTTQNTNNRTFDREFSKRGNIGTMTVQYMIGAEREILINVIMLMLQTFFNSVCLRVYLDCEVE